MPGTHARRKSLILLRAWIPAFASMEKNMNCSVFHYVISLGLTHTQSEPSLTISLAS